MSKLIAALGGGGFSGGGRAIDDHLLGLTGKERPRVCFVPTASGDAATYVDRFLEAFPAQRAEASVLPLFWRADDDPADLLLAQDVIYVGGGNTKSMLALWREWGLDWILLNAANNGTVLAGVSAGAICWFEQPFSDSIPGPYVRLNGLGYLKGSCSPHYDGEVKRRPQFQSKIAAGEMDAGYAFDNFAAGHFVEGQLKQVISSQPTAKGYRVERSGDQAVETMLDTVYLLKDTAHA